MQIAEAKADRAGETRSEIDSHVVIGDIAVRTRFELSLPESFYRADE